MKRFHLENGVTAFKWHNRYDPRGYVPPRGYAAEASLIEHHPATGKFLGESQWWMFLKQTAHRPINPLQKPKLRQPRI